jgi:16S rRNA G1207 methylase RsmC
MPSLFETPFNELSLLCDNENDASIQAWNQADHYLLNVLSQHENFVSQHIGIINDDWGALSIACKDFNPAIYSDSAIFSYWFKKNSPDLKIPIVNTIDELTHSKANVFIMRLPKNLHFFQHQLSLLSQLSNITVYVAGMQKYWPASFFKTADDYFNDIEVLPGIKKAKCMRLKNGKNNKQPDITHTVEIPEFSLQAINYPNVFSRESLDIGTRFFLDNFPKLMNCKSMIDLACGNGLLGIYALKKYADIHVTFIDESHYATKACAASLSANHIQLERHSIIQNNALHELSIGLVDAILCNPPFHQLHRVGDHIANTMIQQSRKALNPNGHLILIGNRHLGYQTLLKPHFKYVDIIASNSKFILFEAYNN